MGFIRQLREMHSLNNAVKEALDTLPSAVCYFTPDGSVKLCNTAMYECYRAIAGKDLQSFCELEQALDSCGKDTDVVRDGNFFLFPDGCTRQYTAREVVTEEGRYYTETVLSDVTELYEKRRALEVQSEEMKEMYAELKMLSGQLLEVTREQEILNMKALLHDQMNMGITAIRQVLYQNSTSKENASAIAQFRRAIRILQEESAGPQNDLNEFIEDARVAGILVHIIGELPEEKKTRQLLIEVMREACVNAARHADASELYIVSEMTENSVTLRIKNNGKQPEEKVVPHGGLKDFAGRIEKAGGKMEIRSQPEFVLTVTLFLSIGKTSPD